MVLLFPVLKATTLDTFPLLLPLPLLLLQLLKKLRERRERLRLSQKLKLTQKLTLGYTTAVSMDMVMDMLCSIDLLLCSLHLLPCVQPLWTRPLRTCLLRRKKREAEPEATADPEADPWLLYGGYAGYGGYHYAPYTYAAYHHPLTYFYGGCRNNQGALVPCAGR